MTLVISHSTNSDFRGQKLNRNKEQSAHRRFALWPQTLLNNSILALILLFSIFLRFYKLEARGLDGSDNVLYTTIAKTWSEGNFIYQVADSPDEPVCRPVVFLGYAAAIKLFGYHDSSIKKINACLDVLNVLLIFLICRLLAQDSIIPAFSASIFYGSLPMAIHMSRIELPHVMSSLFVLLTFFAFACYQSSTGGWRKRFLLILTGALIGLGALTHEDLILLGPGYIIFIICFFLREKRFSQLRVLIIDLSLLSASMLLISHKMLLHSAGFAYDQATTPFETSLPERMVGYFERIPRLVWNSTLANSSSPILYLTLFLLFLLCIRPLFPKSLLQAQKQLCLPFLFYLPLVLVLTYSILYSYFLEEFFIRLFFPLFPLIIIFLVICYSTLLKRVNLPSAQNVVWLGAIITIPFNLEHFQKWNDYMSWQFTMTWASARLPIPFKLESGFQMLTQSSYTMSRERAIYEKLKAEVNSEARLLITPSILYPWAGRRTFQMGYYFGDNAIYLIDHIEPLDELISKYKIKYVLFTNYMADERVVQERFYTKYQYGGRWQVGEELFLGASYGFKPGEYTLEREYSALTDYLERRKAKLLYTEGEYFNSPQHTWHGYRVYQL